MKFPRGFVCAKFLGKFFATICHMGRRPRPNSVPTGPTRTKSCLGDSQLKIKIQTDILRPEMAFFGLWWEFIIILTKIFSKYGSIHFHNILGSYSVCQKLSKNEFFGILANCFDIRQIFGPIFLKMMNLKILLVQSGGNQVPRRCLVPNKASRINSKDRYCCTATDKGVLGSESRTVGLLVSPAIDLKKKNISHPKITTFRGKFAKIMIYIGWIWVG